MSACQQQSAGALTKAQVKAIKDSIDGDYYVNMALAGVPVTMNDPLSVDFPVMPGFPVGEKQGNDYVINNHLSFVAMSHKVADGGWEVVGFRVVPCSMRHAPGEHAARNSCLARALAVGPVSAPKSTPQVVTEGEEIVYTYDVVWSQVETHQLEGLVGHRQQYRRGKVLWISDGLGFMTLTLLAYAMAKLLHNVLHRDHLPLGDNPGKQRVHDRRWKLIAGDVFRPPPAPRALAVCFGSGANLLATAAALLLLVATGACPPACPDSIRRTGLTLFFCFAPLGGFAAVFLLRSMQRSASGWLGVCFKTATFFPGVICAAGAVVSRSLAAAGAVVLAPAALIAPALIFGLPLTVLGGAFALHAPLLPRPTVAPASRNICNASSEEPRSGLGLGGWIMRMPPAARNLFYMAATAITPFSLVHLEYCFAMDSLWLRVPFETAGPLAVNAALAVLAAACVSILTTHMQLCHEDSRWWWPAFRRGGAAAACIVVHAAVFCADFFSGLRGPGLLLYAAYMAAVAAAVYLCLGAAGLAASVAHVTLIYSLADRLQAAPQQLQCGGLKLQEGTPTAKV